jgi:hypothetical protein
MHKASAGIFVWTTWSLYNAIKRDMFKDNNFSHDRVSPTSGSLKASQLAVQQDLL